MKKLFLPMIILSFLFPFESFADRDIKVYGTTPLGTKDTLGGPKKIIEIDKNSGDARVFNTTPLGTKDTLSGPEYIIEQDPYTETAKVYKATPWGSKDLLEGAVGVVEWE